ncbi:AAA family ATPase [Rhizobium sp. KVB221]|uniref:AAA family ATPase n=1 Tax=Rhizobium setariae TaxID=2801340 RepID=A0A936YTE6_9HYPH|nr:AAA family ATPase [Rhizobium setariae]MBL0372417.1 AAA family ATPase [Rhizobium setariae]
MSKDINIKELVDIVRARGANGRSITAIAGAPGSGKSTLAEQVVEALNAMEPGSAAVFPMDGYHLDDLVLVPRGLRPRKGAPQTFDVAGFSHVLGRLKQNREREIAVPVFDRSIEIARAGGRLIPQTVRHLIVEGNYILLGSGDWSDLHRHYDTTVLLVVSEEELRRRLSERWKDLAPADFAFKMEENDLPNGRLVMTGSVEPEFVLRQG